MKLFLKIVISILAVPVVLALVLWVILALAINKSYAPPLHQPYTEITMIELLDTRDDNRKALYTLTEDEKDDFLTRLEDVAFHRYLDDPATHYGRFAVRITYRDGWCDILGQHINSYFSPSGENGAADGWYYLDDPNDYIVLFEKYVNTGTPED